MVDKDHILDEIKRLTQELGGKPPGQIAFAKETGISRHEWLGVYWARWGDALADAGFESNSLNAKMSGDKVLECFAEACRHFGHVATESELRLYSK